MGALTDKIVKAEAWQIFLIFLVAIIFSGATLEDQGVLRIVATILLAVVIFGWLLILGVSLNENLPDNQRKSDTLFIINGVYTILFISLSAILEGMFSDGLAQYQVLFTFYFGFSFFYLIYFVSTLFVSNQELFLEKEKLSVEATFILFVIFVVGVLVLQSRVRRFFTPTNTQGSL